MNNNKNNIIKVVAISTIIGALSLNKGIKVYDDNINHLSEWCPLNNILGIEHQIKRINKDFGSHGIQAYKVENNAVYLTSELNILYEDDNSFYFNLPNGFVYKDKQGVKKVDILDDSIKLVITSGDVVDCEEEVKVYNPEIISYVRKLNKTR